VPAPFIGCSSLGSPGPCEGGYKWCIDPNKCQCCECATRPPPRGPFLIPVLHDATAGTCRRSRLQARKMIPMASCAGNRRARTSGWTTVPRNERRSRPAKAGQRMRGTANRVRSGHYRDRSKPMSPARAGLAVGEFWGPDATAITWQDHCGRHPIPSDKVASGELASPGEPTNWREQSSVEKI
jgi:hypothetical protein